MGKLTFDLEDFQKAAIKFRKDLLKMPLFAISDTTKYMTVRTGITGTELVGEESVKAEFAPYKANRKTDVDLDLKLRPLTTYFGSLNAEFDPNEAISTLLGHQASQAMAGKLVSTPTAREVLAMIGKSAGEVLHDHIWDAVRNPSGTKTVDLFNGFDTITSNEITDGGLAEELGNFIDLQDEFTKENILEIFEFILDVMSPKLRAQQAYIYTTQRICDLYNRAYKKDTGSVPYNHRFEQTAIEGSNGKLLLIPLASKAGSQFMHITLMKNLLVGVDQESDAERVNVKDYAPDTLTYMMRLFFGEQIRSLDPSQILVVKHDVESKKESDPPEEGKDPEKPGDEGGDEGGQEGQ